MVGSSLLRLSIQRLLDGVLESQEVKSDPPLDAGVLSDSAIERGRYSKEFGICPADSSDQLSVQLADLIYLFAVFNWLLWL